MTSTPSNPESLAAATALRDQIGPVGVWLNTHVVRMLPMAAERNAVRRIEAAGYGSLWSGELIGGKEVFAHHALLLDATEQLVIGTGIANVWARHPAAMHGGAATLADAYPGRFVLGIGVSHAAVVERSGQLYANPLAHMRDYVADMDTSSALALPAGYIRVLAAVGPKMLELAAECSDGAHPYLVPRGHTERARHILGADKLLIPEQPVVLCADRADAMALARQHIGPVLSQPGLAYVQNLRRFGFDDDDLAGGGSDRLVEALVAVGDEDAVANRVREELQAGADHVLLNVVASDVDSVVTALERLRPALPTSTK